MFEKIFGECPYKSPTDMGVKFSKLYHLTMTRPARKPHVRKLSVAIIERITNALASGSGKEAEAFKIELLLKQAHATLEDRKVVPAALETEEKTGAPAAALELPDGKIVYGKTSELLGASSALLLNALKELAEIDHKHHVISPDALRPIQELKTKYLGRGNLRLHSDETLIALSISAANNPSPPCP